MSELKLRTLVLVCAGLGALSLRSMAQPNVAVGVDIPGVGQMNADQQTELLNALQQSGVRVVRAWIGTDRSYDFIKKAYALGIKTELTLYIVSPPNAPKRPVVPDMPWMFPSSPLSAADVGLTKSTFQTELNKLEDLGVELSAFELGNEQNNPSFNGEFTIYPKGACPKCKTMGLADLKNDPEGQRIAVGFRNYIQLLAAVKDVRDHSRLNRQTPVLLGGVNDQGPEGLYQPTTARVNRVSIGATIQYMREFGLDDVVDAYGIHVYPSPSGQPGADAARRKDFETLGISECKPQGQGKPCWITEWGFPNNDQSCPVNDANRAKLVREFMTLDIRPAVQQKRIVGLMYYIWERNPGVKQEDPLSIYRCGTLTPSGKLAIDASLLK